MFIVTKMFGYCQVLRVVVLYTYCHYCQQLTASHYLSKWKQTQASIYIFTYKYKNIRIVEIKAILHEAMLGIDVPNWIAW